LVVEDIRTEIEAAGPGHGPGQRVHANGPEDGLITPRIEDSAPDEVSKIHFAFDAVSEPQSEAIMGEASYGEDALHHVQF